MFQAWRYAARRRRLLRQAPPGPVRDYLATRWPDLSTPTERLPMLALDLETTGLDANRDEIVSMGWACLEGDKVLMRSAQQVLVRPQRPLPATSVVIHGVGDDRAATGLSIQEALRALLKEMAGRVLAGHHVTMDAEFISAACRHVGWGQLSLPCVDTLSLLERTARRRQQPIKSGSLTLSAARSSRGLPKYPPHDALWDAIAAAELWLSLNAEMTGGTGRPKLADVVQTHP